MAHFITPPPRAHVRIAGQLSPRTHPCVHGWVIRRISIASHRQARRHNVFRRAPVRSGKQAKQAGPYASLLMAQTSAPTARQISAGTCPCAAPRPKIDRRRRARRSWALAAWSSTTST
eukprot:scaffold21393_cov122-Isochrysis_galbana.AAC.7